VKQRRFGCWLVVIAVAKRPTPSAPVAIVAIVCARAAQWRGRRSPTEPETTSTTAVRAGFRGNTHSNGSPSS